MRPAVRSLLGFSVVLAGLCVLVFLAFAGYFTAWDGRAVSVRARTGEEAVVRVLVVEDDGTPREVDWPVIAVEGLPLRIDARAVPPVPLPDGLPRTTKYRFTLGFTVTPADGGVRSIPTPTPQAAAIALLVFFVGLGLRNMVVAGSPVALERKEPVRTDVPAGAAAGAGPTPKVRGRHGPPPQKPRRGGGRRR